MAKLKILLWGLASVLLLAGVASAQTVSIVSGNGQMTCALFCGSQLYAPLVVVVKDAAGAPVPNATVTWTVTSGGGAIAGGQATTQTTTDANGQSTVTFTQPASFGLVNTSYLQSTVTATVGASSVVFYETTALTNQQGQLQVQTTLLTPAVGQTISGLAGQQATTPIQISVGVPNVEVRLVPPDTTTGTVPISCLTTTGAATGTALSDASGIATCTPVFGAGLGQGQFRAALGGEFAVYGPFNYEIAAGLPCTFRITGGNNQSGNAGQRLPAPLVAQVSDCGGNPLDNIPVTWTITQGAATLTNTRNTSSSGLVSTNVTLGSSSGATQITVAVASGQATANNTPVSVAFTVTTNLVISALQKISGDNQDAAVNTAFAQPLVVQVNNGAQPVPGVSVAWAVTSGSVTLSAASSVTNAQGQASVNVQAGANTGPVAVTATVGTFSAVFNLTTRLPGPSNITFRNGAGFQANFIAPCSVAQITGSGLAPGIQGVVVGNFFGPLPLQVANVTVQFGQYFAPIYSVANLAGQESVTVQVPCELQPGAVPVIIKIGGGSGQFTAQVLPASPGIFETTMSDGRRRAVLLKPDGTFVSIENPARKGEVIRAYVTGLGPVVPAIGTNSPGVPGTESAVPDLSLIVVGVNNNGVRVVSAKYAAGLIGAYEVDFQVPSDAPAGNLPFVVAVNQGGSLLFSNPSAIPVQ